MRDVLSPLLVSLTLLLFILCPTAVAAYSSQNFLYSGESKNIELAVPQTTLHVPALKTQFENSLSTLKDDSTITSFVPTVQGYRITVSPSVEQGTRFVVTDNAVTAYEPITSYIVELVPPEQAPAVSVSSSIVRSASITTSAVAADATSSIDSEQSAALADFTSTLRDTTSSSDPQINGVAQTTPVVTSAQGKSIVSRISATSSPSSTSAPTSHSSIVPLRTYKYALNGFALKMSAADMLKLKKSVYVKNIYPNRKVHVTLHTSLPLVGAVPTWGLDAQGLNCTVSNNACLLGSNVTIGIIDTGIDYTHEDLGACSQATFLAGNCWKVKGGYNFVANSVDPMDDQGHGTHVASIAAGRGGNDWVYSPPSEYWGVAPNATLYAYKVLDSQGSGSYADVIAGIDRAVFDHMQVISLSLGGPGGPDDPVSVAIDNAVINGTVAVVAAGNSGPSSGTIGAPGVARKAITVAASVNNTAIAYFSSRGPVLGTEGIIIKPDITAPGWQICAAKLPGAWSDVTENCSDVDHVPLSGTSMATPFVSGASALYLQAHPSSTPQQVALALKSTANDLNVSVFDQGYGELNITAAVKSPVQISGDLNLGSLGSASLGNATLVYKNIGSSPATFVLKSGFSISDNGSSYNTTTLNESSFTLAAGASRLINVTVNLSLGTEGFFYGFINASVNTSTTNVTVRTLYSFNRLSFLNLSINAGRYPDFFIHDESIGTVNFLYSPGLTGTDAILSVHSGNYTVFAVNGFAVPSRPDYYPDPDEYILSARVDVPVATVANYSFSFGSARPFTVQARNRAGQPLLLASYTKVLASYYGSVGYCANLQTSLDCASPSVNASCSWDSDYGFCSDQMFTTSYINSYGETDNGDRIIYLNNVPSSPFTIDYALQLEGSS